MSGVIVKVIVVGLINVDMRVGVERFLGLGEILVGGEVILIFGGKGVN